MGKLLVGDYSSLFQASDNFVLRSHAPLWLIWTSTSLLLSLFLLSLVKLLAYSCPPPSPRPLGFRRGWWRLSVPGRMALAWVYLHVANGTVYSLNKSRKWRNREATKTKLTDNQLVMRIIWKKRYECLCAATNLLATSCICFAYKLSTNNWRSHTSTIIIPNTKFASDCCALVYLFWNSLLGMACSAPPGKEKNKGKSTLVEVPIFEYKVNNTTNLTNVTHLPTLKSPSGGSPSNNKNKKGGRTNVRIDPTAMFNKLAAVRENGKKKKELTLVGFLVGGPKEFPRIFARLRMEWRPLKGTLNFNVLKSGWFEMVFSNQTDLNMVWANRPYHVFSQLLLIKHWYPGFDPTSESISQMDLWVRLHYLPEEFANSVALETIIEGNLIGKFLKMDPSHNSERWNLFTRFCINTDVEKTIGRGVIIPDEHLNQIKLTLWFDDFSPGCGACGKTAHTFKDCPTKNAPIPTLQLTLKKPPSKTPQSSSLEKEDWNLMGKNNKKVNPSNLIIPNNNIYLSNRGGICVTYESDDSEEGIQHLLESENITLGKSQLLSVAADLHPYNIIMERSDPSHIGDKEDMHIKQNEEQMNKCTEISGQSMFNKATTHLYDAHTHPVEIVKNQDKNNHPKLHLEAGNPPSLAAENELQDFDGLSTRPSDHDNIVNANLHPQEEEIKIYDEEQYDYEYDDLILDEPVDNNSLNNSIGEGQLIMISEDPPFSEKDIEEFINNDAMDGNADQVISEGTFHSIQNSFMSSSSFVNGMERLIVQQSDRSNSNSSKRRVKEGVADTATSEARIGKKPKI